MLTESANPEDFPDKWLLRGTEGGSIYLAEEKGQYLILTDESSMWGLLDEENLKGMSACTVRRFDTADERESYLVKRRWPK